MDRLERIVGENLNSVREEIGQAASRCGRNPEEISVMAVTKTHPAEYVRAAVNCGIRHIGENRVSEGGRKIREVGRETAVFHIIGVLHRKEVRQAVRDFHRIDAVDRPEIIREIARRNGGQPVLLEVNTSGESAKKGFQPDPGELEGVIIEAFELGVKIHGLLTVGPLTGDLSQRREAFELLRKVRDDLAERTGIPLSELSMGMSDDFVQGVLEGATMVRLGRRLFGPRS